MTDPLFIYLFILCFYQYFVDGEPTEENMDPICAIPDSSNSSRKRKLPARGSDHPPSKISRRAAAYQLLNLGNYR